MGLFDQFKNDKEFISEVKFEDISSNQEHITPVVVEHIRSIGIPEEKELKVEFFFYTNTAEKAADLAKALEKLNYEIYHGENAGRQDRFITTGLTTPMQMTTAVIANWAEKMCEIGYTYDCEFDGWGTMDQD